MSSPDGHPWPAPRRSIRLAAWAVLLVGGAAAWIVALLTGPDKAAAWRGLLVAFAFVTPLAASLTLWPAIVQLSRGRWAGDLERLCAAGLGFAPASLAIVGALWASAAVWAPWATQPTHLGEWYRPAGVFIRDLAALCVLWALALAYTRRRRLPGSSWLAGLLAATYAAVISLLAFDLVMSLDWHWSSNLFGGYVFISGLYASIVAWTLLSMFSPAQTADRRHDQAKLIVVFSILTAYLAYAHVLPIWYENLPSETRFLVPRVNFAPWKYVSLALAAVVWLGPLAILLTMWSRRSRWFLAAVGVVLLAGLWVERWWLVAPTFAPGGAMVGAAELGALALCAGAFGLGAEIVMGSGFAASTPGETHGSPEGQQPGEPNRT